MLDYITHLKDYIALDNISSLTLLSTLIIVVILYLFKKINNFYLLSILLLPGTFMHELMHFIVSFISGGKPVNFTVLPKKSGNKITLGSVSSSNIRWYNAALIGLAPLLLIPLSYYLLNNLSYVEKSLYYYLAVYFIANLLYASIPSSTDWKLALKKSWVLIIVVIVGSIGHYYFEII